MYFQIRDAGGIRTLYKDATGRQIRDLVQGQSPGQSPGQPLDQPLGRPQDLDFCGGYCDFVMRALKTARFVDYL